MKSRAMLDRGLGAVVVAASCLLAGPALAADPPAVQGNVQAGAQKVSMCIGCHGIPGYIVAALKEYASGARSFPIMDAIARSLSEQDMADVAAYYSSLK